MRLPWPARYAAAFIVSGLLGCKGSGAGESPDASSAEDGGPDVTSTGDDAGTGSGAITVESPTDATFPGEASIPTACAQVDAGLPPYGSPAGATITGPDLGATVCTGTDVYLSTYISPANRLLLELGTAGVTTFQTPAGAVDGALTMMVSVGTTPGVYTSGEPAACGFVAFTYALGAPLTYRAAAASNCLEGQNVEGSWTLSLTSIVPYPTTPSGTYYVAHGELLATLPSEDDAGPGPVTVSLVF